MGVHGLTTYLRENQRALSKSLSLPPGSGSATPFIVDGWPFIYNAYRSSGLPWVYGGEYDQFYQLVFDALQAWIAVGARIHFVFDGARPELKFPTLVSRISQSHVHPSLLFFRTSAASRGAPRFLNETRIIPPLLYTTCLEALNTIQQTTDSLEVHFADEEGDSYAVELAGRVGGYVIGNDSDFVVLNTDGYLGYIPIEELKWHASAVGSSIEEQDQEFQTVGKHKANRKATVGSAATWGVIPPDVEGMNLSFNIYCPDVLAAHLKIPVALLPLLGALVGNDFSGLSESSPRSIQSLFFDRRLTSAQRITHVANTIRAILSPTPKRRIKQKHQPGSVMDLIDKSVNTLLTRLTTTPGSGEIDNIVDTVVEATLQYAIPKSEDISGLWPTNVCVLHEPELCPLLPMISRMVEAISDEGESKELSDRITIRTKYLDAYRKGWLSPKIMDILNSSTFWPRLFLENPDLETVSRSIGRPIREWVYAIIHDAVGLDIKRNNDIAEESDDEDELISVVESDNEDSSASDNDPLAPLRGQLQSLHNSELRASVSSHSSQHSTPPIITEYIRRGTRVAQEAVIVKPLKTLLYSTSVSNLHLSMPLLLLPQEDRLSVFLQALSSDVPAIRILPSEQLMAALCLRWVLLVTYTRSQEATSKERDNERWTRHEARCFLASFNWTGSIPKTLNGTEESPSIVNRNVQLMAQILMALESIEHLSQTLLLSESLPSVIHMVSGRTFHRYLSRSHDLLDGVISPALWEACSRDLDSVFKEEKKQKKEGGGNKRKALPSNGVKASVLTNGLFELLADIEA